MRIFEENGKMVVKPDGISDKWMFIDKSVDLSKTYFFTPYNEYPDVPREKLDKVLPKGKPYGRSNIIQEYVNELGDEKILKYVPKSVLDGIYGLLDAFVKFVSDNPDDYSLMGASWKVRNLCPYYSHVGGVFYLKNWGIIIEMLALQGLFRWMWAYDIKPDDEGFNEINIFFKWVESFLYVSVESFCQFRPLNPDTAKKKDEELALIHTTKQICRYMLRTSAGYGVQCRIRTFVLGDKRRDPVMAEFSNFMGILGAIPLGPFVYHPENPYFLPQPEGFIDSPNYVPSYSFTPYTDDSTDKDEDSSERRPKALPKELDNVRFKALLQRLVDGGYCEIEDGKYKWIDDKWDKGRSRTALACLAYKVSSDFRLNTKECGDGEIFTNWNIIEEMFDYTGKVEGKNQLKQCRDNWKKSVGKREGDNGKTPFFNPPEINVIDGLFDGLPEIA